VVKLRVHCRKPLGGSLVHGVLRPSSEQRTLFNEFLRIEN
jgi:hypothetical protein